METLMVDAEGKITIPPAVLQKRGLQPADAVALVEAAEGLLVYQGGIDPKTLAWWQTLSDEERRLAEAEVRPLIAAPLLAETQPLQKGRYLRRWARRLRELTFAPEDAIVVAYGSFGLDLRIPSIGVEAIVTTNQKLATHFHARHAEIAHRFRGMIVQLPAPLAAVTLPAVITTAGILAHA